MRTKMPNGMEVDEYAMMLAQIALAHGNNSDQIFTTNLWNGEQWHYHVTRGLRMARNSFPAPERLSLYASGVTLENVERMNRDIDQEYARTTDLTQPLLFVPHPEYAGQHLLIDGWHRLWQALTSGVDEMSAYFLTPEQADEIIVMKIPKGCEPPQG